MTIPGLLFGFITSSLYGALFHLWRGGGAGRLLLYLILSWIGFWAGHFIGFKLNWALFLRIGPLYFGTATLGSFLLLLFGHWLSLMETK